MKKLLICIVLFATLMSTVTGCAPEKRYLELSSGESIQVFFLDPSKKGVDDFVKRFDELLPDTGLGNVFNVTPSNSGSRTNFKSLEKIITMLVFCFMAIKYLKSDRAGAVAE